MTRDQFIQKAYFAATGKATAPTSGNKYDALILSGNMFIEQWQNEPNIDWKSLYRKESVGTISASDRISVDLDEIRKLSTDPNDKVVLTSTDGTETEYDIVKPNQLANHTKCCALMGEELVFSEAFDSDSQWIGATVTAPYYTFAEQMTSANDEVPVDQPLWLVYMTAAEFVRNNDYIKQGQYSNLIAMAQDVMNSMKKNNKESQVRFASRPFTPLGQSW